MERIKTFLYKIIFFAVMITIAVSCSDDIYYRILVELPLIEPRIKGSPTNFVLFNSEMYVAAGRNLWIYNDAGKKWTKKTFSESITQLAATDSRIYMLCYQDKDKEVIRKIIWSDAVKLASDEWETLWEKNVLQEASGKYNAPQTIFSANNKLYVGAKDNDSNNYAVHVFNAAGDYEELIEFSGYKPGSDGKDSETPNTDTAILNGAAYNGSVFLCTGNGIYAGGAHIAPNVNFIGIIKLEDDSIAAITRSGILYLVNTAGITEITRFTDNRLAGAIALWQGDINDANSDKLLLVGRQDREYTTTTGYTYGYMELLLDNMTGGFFFNCSDCKKLFKAGELPEKNLLDRECLECEGTLIAGSFKEPGIETPTSVGDNPRYASSLGIIPINHMYQSKINGILYASTHQNGVWSYKERDKEFLWNSEE